MKLIVLVYILFSALTGEAQRKVSGSYRGSFGENVTKTYSFYSEDKLHISYRGHFTLDIEGSYYIKNDSVYITYNRNSERPNEQENNITLSHFIEGDSYIVQSIYHYCKTKDNKDYLTCYRYC